MTIPTEAIEAAARAWAIHDETGGCFERVDEWEALEDWEREAYPDEYPGSDYEDCGDYRERAIAALTAAAPHMEAALLRRIEVQAFIIAERDKELMQIQGPCRAPGCGLHRAHNGPCTIREGKTE